MEGHSLLTEREHQQSTSAPKAVGALHVRYELSLKLVVSHIVNIVMIEVIEHRFEDMYSLELDDCAPRFEVLD